VKLDPTTNLPFSNMPGVLSMDIRRPFPSNPQRYQLFFGTFTDDNVPAEDTNLPLITESAFCAPCHYGVFWDIPIYNSYGEWLASPYSDPASGKTCQQCHMPSPTLVDGQPLTNVAPGKGGIERDPASIHAHTFPGGLDETLLKHAVSMQSSAKLEDGQLIVSVSITNDQTGHDVPTDSPLRQLILLVRPRDSQNHPLTLLEGPVVPSWGGVGDPQAGYYAGLPGILYTRILEETWTKISPTGAYWNPTRLVSDNRLAPFETNANTFTFSASETGKFTITVTLLYRRAFIELKQQKGWDLPDLVMAEQTLSIP
jgi:hypothetical protein